MTTDRQRLLAHDTAACAPLLWRVDGMSGDRVSGFEDERERQIAPPAGGNGADPAAQVPATQSGPGTALEIYDFGNDAGAGLEEIGRDEIVTPFLAVLQSNSPQVNRDESNYVNGAFAGMFYNTVLGDVYEGKSGVEVVIAAWEHIYGAWNPRDDGGGFRGQYGLQDRIVLDAIARAEKKYGRSAKFNLPRKRDGVWTDDPVVDPNTEQPVEIVEQYNMYCLFAPPPLRPDNAVHVVVGATSTKIQAVKALLTRIDALKYPLNGRMVKPPIWAHRWLMTTVPMENKKGKFYGIRFELAGGPNPRDSLVRPNEELYAMARDFNAMFRDSRVRADYAGGGEQERADDDAGGRRGDDGYRAPF